jgi:cytochrome c-type biogenesis protein CcmF
VIIILAIVGVHEWYALIAILFCSFLIFSIVFEWARGIRAHRQSRTENFLMTFFGLIRSNKSRYGAYIVHISIAFIAVGIIGSSVYDVEKEAALLPGDSMTINNYTLTYESLDYHPTPSKMVFTANVSVYNQDKYIGTLTPQKYFHRSFNQSVSEIAIRSTLIEDLYLILVGWDEAGTTHFKVLVNPLVVWIWIGGGLFLLGGLIVFWPAKRK